MQKITTVTDLKDAIQQLEYKQATEKVLLKEQLLEICESLKPVNIIKNTFKEVYSEPDLKTNIVKGIIGFTTGLVAKNVLIGKTHNPLKKLLGFIVEMVIAKKVAKNADEIKTIGSILLKTITNHRHDSENV